MAVTAKQGSGTSSPYQVSGTTLAEIWKSIEKNGPKYKGQSRAGKTKCNVDMDAKSSKIECTTTQKNKEFEAEAKMTKGTLKYDCTIEFPNLKSDADLSDDAKKEWNRFIKELKAHEDEHVKEFGKEVAAIVKEIDALTASGKGADEKKAEAAAVKAYTKDFTKSYGKAEIDKRMDANADALDAAGHGPTLDTSIA